MIKIGEKDKREIKNGDLRVLKRVLEDHLNITKEFLIDRPSEQLENLRGEARLLREILKLL